ncbi:MAG: hypothetical protein KGH66_02435 [Candidatus Micrarchaeota archaeon]|nr:hypothetical protein [Candidatus Micrarchaeota archaeon]
MDERHNYAEDNEITCVVCGSTDVGQVGGHIFRCRKCGVMWCESCND